MGDEMKANIDRVGNTLVVTLPKSTVDDFDSFTKVADRLTEIVPLDDVDGVVMDLSKVAYAGTPLLAALVQMHLRARRRDKKLAVCSPTDAFLGVIRTVGLDKLLRVFPSRDAALGAMSATAEFYEG